MIRRLLRCEQFGIVYRQHWYGVATICLVALTALEAGAQDGRFPITNAQIMSAMQRRQLPTQGVNVEIAAPVTASSPNAQLEIRSISSVSAHETRLRISCRVRGQCLPFFAVAAWGEHPDSSGAVAAVTTVAKPEVSLERSAPLSTLQELPAVRAGSPATLEIEGDRIHLRFEVICLEKGSTGDTIRVTTRDHKQHFVGKIVTPTLLKGSL